MDGWMRRGRKLQNFPLEILRYHLFCCERYTVEYLLFFGRRRGATVGDPFFSVQLFVICAAGS